MKSLCDACSNPKHDKLLTAYGTELCEDCWDDYLFTPEGKVEYLLGIARGDYPVTEFDVDFLGEAAVQWQRNKNVFDIENSEILRLETILKQLGLL